MIAAEAGRRNKTKYQVVTDTLLADIESGKLKPGDRLPSEDQLVSKLGYSLGTVQRALRDLVDQGVVIRVHGSGTFVKGARPPDSHLRHFRFRAEGDDTLLPVFFETLKLERTQSLGPWCDFLNADCASYIRIERLISVNEEFEIFSELYLPGDRFAPLLDMEAADLDGVSIRDMLSERFNTPTVKTEQRLGCGLFPPRVTRRIGMPAGLVGMILTISSETFRHTPIIWQRAFIPPSDREMELMTALVL